MATIGNFTKKNDGYTGNIQTLTFKAKVEITPVEASGDKAPNYRVYANKAEIGAAWNRTSESKRKYVCVKVDDPSFPAPIFANLVERDGQYDLIWSR